MDADTDEGTAIGLPVLANTPHLDHPALCVVRLSGEAFAVGLIAG